MSTKRLRRHAHQPEAKKDSERLTLAPLTFEQALKGALATKPQKGADQDKKAEGEGNDA